jgi:hypothetical protein
MNPRLWLALTLLAPMTSLASDLAAPPIPRQVHADRAFTDFFRRTNGWTAGDGAISIPLSDGRVLWLFGDSHVDDLDPATGTIPCLFQTRNAALLQSSNSFTQARTLIGKGPGFRSWFKNSTNDNFWFWPLCGFQRGNTVFVYLVALHKTGAGGMWDFASIGHDYWARIKFPGMDTVTYSALPPFNGVAFGMGFVNEGDFTYAFGGKQKGLASDVFVARFRSEEPEGPWRFWDGTDWAGNPTNAVAIARGASTSIHVCKLKDRFLLATSAFSMGCDQGKDIYLSTSRKPTGPFSERKLIYTIDDKYQGHLPFFYFPFAHPEFINERNELLLTYSINGYEPCVSACIKGRGIPDHYRPKAIRVPLELIAPD